MVIKFTILIQSVIWNISDSNKFGTIEIYGKNIYKPFLILVLHLHYKNSKTKNIRTIIIVAVDTIANS